MAETIEVLSEDEVRAKLRDLIQTQFAGDYTAFGASLGRDPLYIRVLVAARDKRLPDWLTSILGVRRERVYIQS